MIDKLKKSITKRCDKMSIHANDWKEIVENIGQHIKKKREVMELTQEKLAELMDVSITTISRLENGQQCMSVKNLIKLAKILHLDVSDLFSSYKFSDSISMKSEDELILAILNQSSTQQKKHFIEYMKWFLDHYPHLQP